MSDWKRHLRAAAEATEPEPGAVQRLQDRAAWPRQLLQQAQIEPPPGALARLRARPFQARTQTRWLPIGAAVGMAAAVMLALLWPPTPAPLSARLAAATRTDQALTPKVQLGYAGAGEVAGTDQAPRIRWEAGTLEVDVTPKQGIDLSVETDEGLVQVVGTSFSVTRDALGTAFSVSRGAVRVTCVGASPVDLGANERVVCLPVRTAGWLGRVQALAQAGRSTDELLAEIDRGLKGAAPADPAAGELLALRIRVLLDAQRLDEALVAAEAYLASGAEPRRAEVSEIVSALSNRP